MGHNCGSSGNNLRLFGGEVLSKENYPSVDISEVLKVLGVGIALLISLSTVIGWTTQNVVSDKLTGFSEKMDSKYVNKEVFMSELKGLNYKIDSIGKAVGARFKK